MREFEIRAFMHGVDFETLPTRAEVEWWRRRIRLGAPSDPRHVCDYLVRGLAFDLRKVARKIDPSVERASIEIYASDHGAEVFTTGRSIEFDCNQVHLDTTGVEPSYQGRGYGVALARNAFRLARHLGFARLGVTAIDVGSYVWAKSGFLPTAESWEEGNSKQRIAECLERIDELTWSDKAKVYQELSSSDPTTLWMISDFGELVRSTRNRNSRLPLGKVLLTESGASWYGTLEFYRDDGGPSDSHLHRARAYLGLDEDE
ncbi:GNAT family N-acetyltransferase [Rhizobium leguminosarum]|uniref:GNAT family N-acetyltransferase n=1 Tax=Rhizobium leguminosarum TaxID=384 RepID=UPI00067EE131|nr:GNAT family N-acetyltransferase [Rhizobium leguminosarum]